VIPWAAPQRGDTGQGLTEFTIVMPVFLLLLVGMLEFGLAFSQRLTLSDATRQGARIGAALATGSSTPCTGDPSGVDIALIAGVQNILESGGSIDMTHVNSIRIYRADSNGRQLGSQVNTWVYTPGAGPDADPGPGTQTLDFSPSSVAWPACNRNNGAANPDSIGVSVDYVYHLQTPLAALMALFGGSQPGTIEMVDSTVMALNPTS
jgi:Flp pilus assembly protein TadG